jgi:hypothetical protein
MDAQRIIEFIAGYVTLAEFTIVTFVGL